MLDYKESMIIIKVTEVVKFRDGVQSSSPSHCTMSSFGWHSPRPEFLIVKCLGLELQNDLSHQVKSAVE